MDPETAALLVDLMEKVGLLRRDLQQKHDLEKYEARLTRIDSKLSALAEHIAGKDPALAKALLTAWTLPARSLAFRNAGHQPPPPRKSGEAPPSAQEDTPDEGGEG